MVTVVEPVFTSEISCPTELSPWAITQHIQQVWCDRHSILAIWQDRPALSDVEFLHHLALPTTDELQHAIAAGRAYLAEIFQLSATHLYPDDAVSQLNQLPGRNWDQSELVWVLEESLGIELDDSDIAPITAISLGQWLKALLLPHL